MVRLAADLVAGYYILVTGRHAVVGRYAIANPYESSLVERWK